jgi:hypothetical protein
LRGWFSSPSREEARRFRPEDGPVRLDDDPPPTFVPPQHRQAPDLTREEEAELKPYPGYGPVFLDSDRPSRKFVPPK